MSLIESLKEKGVNVDEGLERVMGDASLYEMMLGMFVDSVRDNPISPEDYDAANLEDLIKRVHALKGITGNLSLTPLFEGYNESLVLLRAEKPAEAKAKFEGIQSIQEEILECIKNNA